MSIPLYSFKTVTKAIAFAIDAHGQQKRKARNSRFVPYMVHPVEVMNILIDSGIVPIQGHPDCQKNCNILVAALLHDVLEDTPYTESDIKQMFGKDVLSAVKGLTDDPNLSKEQQRQAQLDHMLDASFEVRCVKVADKTSNVRDLVRCPPGWKTSSVKAYSEHAALVVAHAAAKNDLSTELVQSFWTAKKDVADWVAEQELRENGLQKL